ncbi:PLK/PLK1 protein kinase [Loa loa]|uniref:Serine/threonine-protein kinase PLK n=1 Tax=Loa loa TaxID=7209 RepID=A0A1I7VR93_LOALO|nr:PLK/PLK1 protein kinase [Loa loa]EFO27896.1 PLK/PLK1 protein kinase [Loa loa]
MSSKKPVLKEVPDVVVNPDTGVTYKKGRFLGKGGFARCYELTDIMNQKLYAGKVVSKLLLLKNHQRDKMAQEIRIHRNLQHKHIVRMDGFFEDPDNVYILLELCPRRSLMELHKRRKYITEPESRYFTKQIVEACEYLHENKIIHRDLKLGNLFLNEEMEIKVGDFGLATVVEVDGQRKKTLCGTPNYIAPEMLDKKGHSYEVDIWAIGCILYTLLVGKPPFETSSLKDTYNRIKNNNYSIPGRISDEAEQLIRRLLQTDPDKRPTIHEVSNYAFFKGYTPSRLPTSCLTMAPKFANTEIPDKRSALNELRQENILISPKECVRKDLLAVPVRPLTSVPELQVLSNVKHRVCDSRTAGISCGVGDYPSDCYLSGLCRQLAEVVNSKPKDNPDIRDDDLEDPAAMPVFWISKWVDYSDKYGLGYQLCDNSIGVVFNDNTKMVLDAAGEQVQYLGRENDEHYYTVKHYPEKLQKKITLLQYFKNYMTEHLQKAGADMPIREGDELARLPVLRIWFRTQSAIVLHLTNGTLQLNFFEDHTKLVICPLMGAATYIDSERNFRVLKLSALAKYGCPKALLDRLRYAKMMVERLMLAHSARPFSSTLTSAARPAPSTAGNY